MENLTPGGGLKVPDKNVGTSFKFHVNLSRSSRSSGGYYSGKCSLVLVYKDNYGATIDLASREFTDVDFNDVNGRPTGAAVIAEAVLPQALIMDVLFSLKIMEFH